MQLELFVNELGEWVDVLACDVDELQEKLQKDSFYVSDVDSDFNYKYEGVMTIEELEELAEDVNTIEDEYDEEAFKALMEYLDDFNEAFSTLIDYNYTFYPEVEDREDLGRYVVEEGLWGENIPENLLNYIDYEAIGRDIDLNASGCFTENGFIEVY